MPSPTSPLASSPLTGKPRRQGRGFTALWAVVGMLCCVGVILAVVDPSLIGRATGSAMAGAHHGEAQEQPTPKTPRPARAAVQPRTPDAQPAAETIRDHSAREARADRLIKKLITKMRAEREARKASATEIIWDDSETPAPKQETDAATAVEERPDDRDQPTPPTTPLRAAE